LFFLFKKGNTYDIAYFINHPKEALPQAYNLILANEIMAHNAHNFSSSL